MLELIPSPIISFIGFILTISFLVFIHEYGHFWVAKRFGVKIEKFSVGFGKPIIQWIGKKDQTKYSLSWIPLGGYVKMYDDNRQENLDNDLRQPQSGSFSLLSPQKRFLIAFAGPAINIVFAILALWLLFIIGIPAIKPKLGSISTSSPLYQHVAPNNEIIAINNNKVSTLTDTVIHFIDQIGNSNITITTKDNNQIKQTSHIDLSNLPKGSELDITKALGIKWSFTEFGQNLPAIIEQVKKDSPADIAGLLTHDKILEINKQDITSWGQFVAIVQKSPNIPLELVILRNKNQLTTTIKPSPHPTNSYIGYVGVTYKIDPDVTKKLQELKTTKRFGPIEALFQSISSNYTQAKLTLKMLTRIITGEASIDNLGGPLTIADTSGQAIKSGYITFFTFLAAISLAIAIMNLLPIPILDGGHMLLCLTEMIRKKPLSEKTSKLLHSMGATLMITFMFFIIFLDLSRYLP